MAACLIRRQGTEDRGQNFYAAAPRLFAQASVFCLLSSILCPLTAEELPDPTRPPAEISAGSASAGLGASPVDNGLQSIIISPSRRAAIINGQTVELGAKYGNARLVEVNERGVVLLGKQGKQGLALFPGVQLKMKGTDLPAQLPPTTQKIKKYKLVSNKAAKAAAPKEVK